MQGLGICQRCADNLIEKLGLSQTKNLARGAEKCNIKLSGGLLDYSDNGFHDIDIMLNKVADYYDSDVEYTLRNLSTMIEPILLLFIGGMVLFLALAVFLPMWNVMNLFKH